MQKIRKTNVLFKNHTSQYLHKSVTWTFIYNLIDSWQILNITVKECSVIKRWRRLIRSPTKLYASLCYPTNPTQGREITPSSDLFNTAPSGGGVWGGIGLQVLRRGGGQRVSGWLQPVESDNIAFLLMPHRRPGSRIRGGGYIFPVPHENPSLGSLLSRLGLLTPKYV